MALRKDPVPAAALYITKLFDWAKQHMDDMVCTIGRMETKPGSVNVIPDTVTTVSYTHLDVYKRQS